MAIAIAALVTISVVMLMVTSALLWLLHQTSLENSRMLEELRMAYSMLGDAVEQGASRVGIPIHGRERPVLHGENVASDGTINRTDGSVIEPLETPDEEGGPQPMKYG